MRIRGRLLKMPDWSFIAQPEAPLPRFMLALPPPPPPPKFMLAPPPLASAPASYVAPADSSIPTAAPEMVCMLNYQWYPQHDALDPEIEELNGAPIGSPWRKPRAMPGLAYTPEASSMEVQAEGKIGKKVTKIQAAPKKMKQGRNDNNNKKKNNKKGKVIQKDVLSDDKAVNHFRLQEKTADGKPRCKKNDGKNWQCKKPTAEPNTLCDHHIRRKSSSSEPEEAAPGANAKSATAKALAAFKSAPMKASANSKSALVKTSARSEAGPASAASRSKAAPSAITLLNSRKQRKKKVDDDFSGEFYYYDLFSPFRGKQRGNYISNNIVEAAANVEEKKSPQEDSTAEAREEDYAATEAQGQGYNPPDDALDSDNIDEIVEDDEESDDDYCAPLVRNSKSRAKNDQRKVYISDLNCPKMGMKRFKSLMTL